MTQLTLLFLAGLIDLRYGDESAFHLSPTIPYAWIKKGEDREIPAQKGGNLNVFRLLNLQGQLTSYQITGRINSELIIYCLDDFCQKISKLTVLVLDNAPWHCSKLFQAKIPQWEEKNLFIVFLPTYSPEFNPAEILWRKIKYEWLRIEDYQDKKTLHQRISHILKNYNSEFKINLKPDFNIRLVTY